MQNRRTETYIEEHFENLSVRLSVRAFVEFMNNFIYHSSLLTEFIEIFNTFSSHYFSTDEHIYGDDDDSDGECD